MDTGAGCAARWTFGGGSGSLGIENDVGAVQPDPEDSDGRLGMGVIIDEFLLGCVVFLLRRLHHYPENRG